MKILFFHRWVGVHPGGAETHLKELARRFADRGHTVSILTREGPELIDFHPNIRIYRISQNFGESDHSYEDWRLYWHTGLFMWKSLGFLLRLYRQGVRFDCISCHFVTESYVARVIRFLFGTPIMFILEGYTPWEAREARRANRAVAISAYEADRCYRAFGFRPTVIHIGIDRSLFAPAARLPKNPAVLCVARLEPRKDYPTLIQAAKVLKTTNPKPEIKIAGTGIAEQTLKAMARRQEVAEIVQFLGHVPEPALPKLYQTASLFVLPTLEEGLGIVLLEAMSAGLPVIASKVGAVPEVLGDAGILISPRRPKQLATAIHQVLSDKILAERLRQASLRRAGAFDWESKIVEYERAYTALL